MNTNETPHFDGDTIDDDRDHERLARQLDAVRDLMLDGDWRTLAQIADATGAPESSISARLRDLRKDKFGGFIVTREYLTDGLWQYRVERPTMTRAWTCLTCGTSATVGVESRLGGYGYGPCPTCHKRTMMRGVETTLPL